MVMPWLVGGDFNVVMYEGEKIGGLPVHPPEYDDFAFCVNSSGLFDLGYKGSPFTWGNGSPNIECIFKRLDKILEVVRQNWVADFIGDHFLMFKQKLKKMKIALSTWSKVTYGDISKQLATREDIVRVKAMLFEEEPTMENRIVLQKAQAELKKYLSIKEQYWKQKARMAWFTEGDRNTRFFHNHVNGKRHKLQLKRIQNADSDWIENHKEMATTATEFYEKQFSQEEEPTDFSMLSNVPAMVIVNQNLELSSYPTIDEVKQAVFTLSGDSGSGPDRFTCMFYQECWDIIGQDIHLMVLHFYGGLALSKSITHTNLVLLPKKPQVQTFSNLRPISLSNFINKVMSRVLHDRLEHFLPTLISSNQSGFVKARSIFENILLTQEIVTGIRLRAKPTNMVIKLDMTKAYDMTDPLNHLAYTDDAIIFASTHAASLKKIMEVLSGYEKVSGQLINKTNSSYYMYARVANSLVHSLEDITGFSKGAFSFTYLGCPIFYTRRRKDYYEDLIKKVEAKLHSWKGSSGVQRRKEEAYIGLHGRICAYQKKKEA
uniref:Reverse transcriptase domain-containing protein n=1 Tax=Nicotiana tabacum TaxID=4097 RepID=A0A1S4A3M6_TOBAC|nr:PREDICTED: uncharacterized protein LOC107793412 [Nicotiana tabacum]